MKDVDTIQLDGGVFVGTDLQHYCFVAVTVEFPAWLPNGFTESAKAELERFTERLSHCLGEGSMGTAESR